MSEEGEESGEVKRPDDNSVEYYYDSTSDTAVVLSLDRGLQ